MLDAGGLSCDLNGSVGLSGLYGSSSRRETNLRYRKVPSQLRTEPLSSATTFYCGGGSSNTATTTTNKTKDVLLGGLRALSDFNLVSASVGYTYRPASTHIKTE